MGRLKFSENVLIFTPYHPDIPLIQKPVYIIDIYGEKNTTNKKMCIYKQTSKMIYKYKQDHVPTQFMYKHVNNVITKCKQAVLNQYMLLRSLFKNVLSEVIIIANS